MPLMIRTKNTKNNQVSGLDFKFAGKSNDRAQSRDCRFNWYKLLLAGAIASFSTLAVALNPVQAQDPVPTENPTNTSDPTPTDTPSDVEVSSVQRFSCQIENGQYVVMYQPKSQPDRYFPWAQPSAMGGGWSPERRCYEISRRLESYRPDGLVELRTSTENGYNILCATTEKRSDCRIVLTVPVGDDPNLVRDRVFGNLTTADSGQPTTAVPTFVEGDRNVINSKVPELLGIPDTSELGNLPNQILGLPDTVSTTGYRGNGIYLKPFLDPADGGTGTALVNGIRRDRNQLNPNNFR
jgi:hypothetical protein